MVGWGEIAVDTVLSSLYVYLLIRLATASDAYFKTPFYKFFIATGVYSVVAVVTYHIVAQITYSLHHWTIIFYKAAFAINFVGAEGASLGKGIIAVHRYYVMRRQDFSEKKLSRSVVRRLLLVQFAISLASSTPIWLADYVCMNTGTKDELVVLTRDHTLIAKGIAVGTYALYIICNGAFTVLTSREMLRLRKLIGSNSATSSTIMQQQRNMFAVVTVCSLSHLVKALQQFAIAVSTYFSLSGLYNFIWPWYPLANGLATYAAPICLVLLASTVRKRLIPRNVLLSMGSSTIEITPSNNT